MLIRKAYDDEVYQIMQWSNLLTEELTGGYMTKPSATTNEMVANVITKGGYYLVLQNHLEVVGWILIGSDLNYYKLENVGFIYELYVFPRFRNFGYGKQLMKHALEIFKKQGLKTAQLNVFSGNSAKIMYEKLGFNVVTSLMECRLDK